MEMELLLDDITKPGANGVDWGKVGRFAALVKREKDQGANDAVSMLLDKIRNRNPQVALAAMTILEGCVKNCGVPIHSVVGKFRFLNEFIKMVSPKYYSDTPTEVKRRILACMQQWNFSLMEQSKVREAYQMLVRQGVEFPDDVEMPQLDVPCGEGYLDISAKSMVKRHSPLEEDAKKAKLLEKLLKSKDPNDLMKANKLIKKMVEIDAKKGQKAAETSKELDIVRTNAKLLTDMLMAHNPAAGASLAQNEVIQGLYKSCVEMRPKMFKMASNLDEEDPALGDVLTANDELTRVLDLFEEAKTKEVGNGAGAAGLMMMDVPAAAAAPAAAAPASNGLLDLFSSPVPQQAAAAGPPLAAQFGGLGLGGMPAAAAPPAAAASNDLFGLLNAPAAAAPMAGGGLMDLLGGPSPAAAPLGGASALDMFGSLGSPMAAAPAASTPAPPLESITMPLEMIQPGAVPPVNVYDKNNLRLTFVFAKNPPHPTIATVVISAMNLGMVPITGLSFQAAVPKALQVKLQPASSTTVPASNPMLGSQSVTQVMLIANPTKVPIKIRFKLDFTVGTQPMTDMGECSSFPPM